jgi:hypothetical protein
MSPVELVYRQQQAEVVLVGKSAGAAGLVVMGEATRSWAMKVWWDLGQERKKQEVAGKLNLEIADALGLERLEEATAMAGGDLGFVQSC